MEHKPQAGSNPPHLPSIPNELKPTVIIQARIGSSRLPGKVLIDIAGRPMLVHVVERARLSSLVKEVVVATTHDPSDDPIARLCDQNNYLYFRGSPLDVLDRYFQAALTFQATNVLRLTGDCPLIDPNLIDQTIHAFHHLQPFQATSEQKDPSASSASYKSLAPSSERKNADFAAKRTEAPLRFDFACTRLPPPWHRTFPIGQDIEVCTFSALKRAWEESSMPYHREHVMPYLYEEPRSIHFGIHLGTNPTQIPELLTSSMLSDPDPFYVLRIDHNPDYGNMRWTVDTPEDLEYVQKILSHFSNPDRKDTSAYSWQDVLDLLQKKPELAQINQRSKAKDYREVDERLKR